MGVVFGQNLGQIRFNVVKKKETGIINRFFHILHREYILKQEEWLYKHLSGNLRQI